MTAYDHDKHASMCLHPVCRYADTPERHGDAYLETPPVLTTVQDGSVTTTHVGPAPTEEDCGCELGTPVLEVFRQGTICTGCGEQVDQ